MIDDTFEPRLLREPDERNMRLRAVWFYKFQHRMHYADFRGELTGLSIDYRLASRRRLAGHMCNKVRAEMRMQKFREERKHKPENVVSIFHKRQAG